MAKSRNLYTRGLQKRLGGAVWYQSKGETRVRELAAHVSNPQSDAQMEQRVKLSNLVAIYRANKAWMNKYSFESKPKTWSDYNAFVSANLKNNDIYLEKSSVDAGAAVVAPYIFTKGTLPNINLVWDTSNEEFYTDLFTGDLSIMYQDNTTVAQLTAALIENNNGLREGDQISFIQNIQRTDSDGTPFVVLRYNEIILDLADSTLVTERVGDLLLTDEYENETRLCMVTADTSTVVGGLVCISRNVEGSIKVSTQRMVVTDSAFASQYKNLRKAVRSYAVGSSEPFLVPIYGSDTNDAPLALSIVRMQDDDSKYINPGTAYAANELVAPFTAFLSNNPEDLTVQSGYIKMYTSQNATIDVPEVTATLVGNSIDISKSGDGAQWPQSAQYFAEIGVVTNYGTLKYNFPWGGEIGE